MAVLERSEVWGSTVRPGVDSAPGVERMRSGCEARCGRLQRPNRVEDAAVRE